MTDTAIHVINEKLQSNHSLLQGLYSERAAREQKILNLEQQQDQLNQALRLINKKGEPDGKE